MSLFVDARRTASIMYRLWDTQAGRYASGELAVGGMTFLLNRILLEGEIPSGPAISGTIARWIKTAEERGTNDPKVKADADLVRPWRDGPEPFQIPGPIRRALWSRALTEQLAQTVFEQRLEELTVELLPAGGAFLHNELILHELARGPGIATLRKHRDDARSRALVREIDEKLVGIISVRTQDVPDDPDDVLYVFRLT